MTVQSTMFAFAALLLVSTSPALAIECQSGEGKAIEIDFKVGLQGQPLPNLPPRIVSERCTTDRQDTTYRFKGLDVDFGSQGEAVKAFDMAREVMSLGINGESVAVLFAFTAEVEAKYRESIAAK